MITRGVEKLEKCLDIFRARRYYSANEVGCSDQPDPESAQGAQDNGKEVEMSEQEKSGGDAGDFDANAFEKKTEAEKLAAVKDDLTSVVKVHDVEGVGETPITKLDILSSQWRQAAVRILKDVNPDAYEKYRAIKYPDGSDGKPTLEIRQAAYAFIIGRFLDLSYTEVEPDKPTNLQVIGESWRQQAVQLLRVIDPEGYAEYRKSKYGTGQEPSFEMRKLAYGFAIQRFLDVSYKIAGF